MFKNKTSPYILLLTCFVLIASKCFSMDVSLTWDKNSSADYYIVFWGTESGTYTGKSNEIDVNSNFYTVKNLNIKKYYFSVKAFNEFGNSSDYSEEVSNQIPDFATTITTSLNGATIVVNTQTGFSCTTQGGTPPYSYSWDFGTPDLDNSIEPSPEGIIYKNPGTYEINLSVTDSNGFICSSTRELIVKDIDTSPRVEIILPSEDNISAYTHTAINFRANITDGNKPLQINWTVNGKTKGSESEFLEGLYFSDPGEYSIQITVTDSDGDIGYDIIKVSIAEPETEKIPPEKPVIYFDYPTNAVPLTPKLSGTKFSSENTGVVLAESYWQIFEKTDFSTELVFSRRSPGNIQSIIVPDMVLKENTTYLMCVQYTDSNYLKSDFSNSVEFTTKSYTFTDTEPADGIPDSQEDIDYYDINNNGFDDLIEADLLRLSTTNGCIIGIQPSDANVTIERFCSYSQFNEGSSSNMPSYIPMGYIGFRLTTETPGETVKIKLFFDEKIPSESKWFKYDSILGWFDYSAHSVINKNRHEITLTLQDGGYGDSDGIKNSVIIDPGGLSVDPSLKISFPGSEQISSNCFINSLTFQF